MKLPVVLRKNWKRVATLSLVIIIFLALVAWTAISPTILVPQSTTSLSESLFQYAKDKSTLNITDGEGTYSFLFGIDYNESLNPGVPTIVEVYISMQSEQKSSGFLKGVGLQILSSRVLVDGIEDSGVTSMITTSSGIITDRLSNVDINDTSGIHELSTRLIVSTEDVNYIGYFGGSEQVISLNGTIAIQ
jgi:hypothetical protein